MRGARPGALPLDSARSLRRLYPYLLVLSLETVCWLMEAGWGGGAWSEFV